MSLNDTPRGNRLHIGLFGRCNSGKSSLVNALTNQQAAMVSKVAGTTTDPVYKAMELFGIGPVVFIDTAGFDDDGELGRLRIEKTKQAALATDVALVLFHEADSTAEFAWVKRLQKQQIPVIAVVSKSDELPDGGAKIAAQVRAKTGLEAVCVSVQPKKGLDALHAELVRQLPEDFAAESITAGLCRPGDTVLLVMPQDIQAPKRRLILPQVQTLRELLDRKCMVVSATADKFQSALACLNRPPQLIITDSQVFKYVYEHKPAESRLTSFSVLFAAYKGDLAYYAEGARHIDKLDASSRVLIAECCTHAPLQEDIGRVKLPRLLRQRLGEHLRVDVASGTDFPENPAEYDLIIQCGGCMFNRQFIMARIAKAKEKSVPMTNYGIAIAYLSGILDKISF